MKYLFLLLLPLTAHAQIDPHKSLLICSCNEPAVFIFEEDGKTHVMSSRLFDDKTQKNMKLLCKAKKPVEVWEVEKITGKHCPLSL